MVHDQRMKEGPVSAKSVRRGNSRQASNAAMTATRVSVPTRRRPAREVGGQRLPTDQMRPGGATRTMIPPRPPALYASHRAARLLPAGRSSWLPCVVMVATRGHYGDPCERV